MTQIDPFYILVLNHLFCGAAHQYMAVMQDVSAVDDFKRFTHVMVGDQHTYSAIFEVMNKGPNFRDGNWINASKRFVQ